MEFMRLLQNSHDLFWKLAQSNCQLFLACCFQSCKRKMLIIDLDLRWIIVNTGTWYKCGSSSHIETEALLLSFHRTCVILVDYLTVHFDCIYRTADMFEELFTMSVQVCICEAHWEDVWVRSTRARDVCHADKQCDRGIHTFESSRWPHGLLTLIFHFLSLVAYLSRLVLSPFSLT